jgi:hypothetical protein
MSPIDVLTHPCILIFLISYRDVTSCSDSTSSMDVSWWALSLQQSFDANEFTHWATRLKNSQNKFQHKDLPLLFKYLE